jgi:3-oxoadipate enol-lactonase
MFSRRSIYYQIEGNGPPLLFLHGLGGTHRMWAPQMTHFAKTHRCVAVDLRGTGRSPSLDDTPEDSVLDVQCDDMADLMDELRIDRAVVAGVSFGGMVRILPARPRISDLCGIDRN